VLPLVLEKLQQEGYIFKSIKTDIS